MPANHTYFRIFISCSTLCLVLVIQRYKDSRGVISDSRVTNVKNSFVLDGGVQFITSSNGSVLTTEEPRVKCWEKKTFLASVVWVGDQELPTEALGNHHSIR